MAGGKPAMKKVEVTEKVIDEWARAWIKLSELIIFTQLHFSVIFCFFDK